MTEECNYNVITDRIPGKPSHVRKLASTVGAGMVEWDVSEAEPARHGQARLLASRRCASRSTIAFSAMSSGKRGTQYDEHSFL